MQIKTMIQFHSMTYPSFESSILDPQDMVENELLDRLSILTYLSQFYQAFHGSTAPGTTFNRLFGTQVLCD